MVTRTLTNTELESKLVKLFDEVSTPLDLHEILRHLEMGGEMDQVVLEAIWQLVGREKLTLTQDRKFARKPSKK